MVAVGSCRPAIDAVAVGSTQFRVPEYERSYPETPQRVRLKQFDFGIYELVPRGATTKPFDLDIGGTDDLHVVGFHGKERRGDGTVTFRWSRPTSLVLVPDLAPDMSRLTVWLSAGARPTGLSPPTVDILLADRQLGTVTVTEDVLPYEFTIDEDHAAEIIARDEVIQVSITSDTWNPSETVGAEDAESWVSSLTDCGSTEPLVELEVLPSHDPPAELCFAAPSPRLAERVAVDLDRGDQSLRQLI